MRKLSLLMVLLLSALLLFGCNDATPDTDETEISTDGIAWSAVNADDELVGTWQLDSDEYKEYYKFTNNCKIQILQGSTCFEGDVNYGIDVDGVNYLKSDFYYMYGEFTYVIEGDVATLTTAEGNEIVLNRSEYNAETLTVYEDFNAENPLVGTWFNDEYQDGYVFGEDGKATYELTITDYACYVTSYYVYKVSDDTLCFMYDSGSGVEEMTYTYVIDGDKLTLNGDIEYTRQ